MLALVVAGGLGVGAIRAELVARWRFEPPVRRGVVERGPLSNPARGGVVVPPKAGLGPGRFGLALWPGGSGTAEPVESPPALRIGGDDPRLSQLTNPTDTRLNLGAHDWTLECWLWLDAHATDEGVIFEIGAGPPGVGELVTRCRVVPRENAFVLDGIVLVTPGEPEPVGRRIEFNDPAGPPHGVARLEEVTLAPGAALPRGRWFHMALVHARREGTVRLFLDGRGVVAAPAQLSALPRVATAYLAFGCDGGRGRVLAGAIDDLRVHDAVHYRENFAPAGTAEPPEEP